MQDTECMCLRSSRARDPSGGRPALSPCRCVFTWSPPSSQHIQHSSGCPCTLQEDALPAQEPATLFKQQRCFLADVKLIMHPQKKITEQNAPDICQQTEAQPSPDCLTSSHSHIFTCTHHHFSGYQMTFNLSSCAPL